MINYSDPEVLDALVKAFEMGYNQGVEDFIDRRDDADREVLSFRLKLDESVEFAKAVQKDFNNRALEKLLIGGENENSRESGPLPEMRG